MAGANGYKKTTTAGHTFYELEVNLRIAGVSVLFEDPGCVILRTPHPQDMKFVAKILQQAYEEAEGLVKMGGG